jgi:L-threonylcarbamoyladenylate synthase
MIPVRATDQNIRIAAEHLREGRLVAIPTETVYGIAADATNADAVRKIFSAKDRPADNPIIIHISDFTQLDDVVDEWPASADTLARRFWPGPLTLVLKKAETIPSEVTGGLDTVAVRMPDHPVALALIEELERPVAAPSANRFMRLSPTRAEHIEPEIADRLEMILDGGPSTVGVESTVVDCTVDPPRILRPGGVSRGDIQAALGQPLGLVPPNPLRRSPGMYARHYAPKAEVKLVDRLGAEDAGLGFSDPQNQFQVKMPADPRAYAAALYDALYRVDSFDPQAICVELPPEDPEWEAVHDRLRKASSA